jgi:cysteine desulfurase family protein (TIGR01976 family)
MGMQHKRAATIVVRGVAIFGDSLHNEPLHYDAEMSPIDVDRIRKHFPALERDIGGQPALFADAPGGTQVPLTVIEAMAEYLAVSNANELGAFPTSAETDAVIDGARVAAADLLGCSAGEVVFGPNMTTLAFSLSRALARTLNPGDEVVVSALDHDANIAPWIAAAEDAGATVRWVDFDAGDCTLDLESLEAVLSDRTRLCAFTLASNAVGTITPVGDIVRRIRGVSNALVVADAVHFAPHRAIDVRAFDVDFLFCSPYKFFGPHLGMMFGKRSLLERIRPYRVRPASDEPPASWETGTRSHEALAGFVACVDYLASVGDGEGSRRERVLDAMQAVGDYEAGLSRAFLEAAEGLDDVTLYGITERARISERTPTFALRVAGESPLASATRLAEEGVFVWDGNYYAPAVMERLGIEEMGGAVRVGFCHYHSVDEVQRVAKTLAR